MPKTEGIARLAADTPRAPANAPPPPPRPLADVTCARAQWTPQPAALPTSPLSPSFAMPPPRRLTMRNAGRAVELVLFSLPLQRSGCAQRGNPAATPVCAHRNSPPFPDLTRRATPARTFMTHASYAATHVDSHHLTSLACRVTVLPRRRYGRRRMTRGGNDGCEAARRSWLWPCEGPWL